MSVDVERSFDMPPGQTLGRISAPLSAICPTRLVSQPSLRVKHRKRQQNVEKAGAGAVVLVGRGEGAEESAGHPSGRCPKGRTPPARQTDGRRFPVDTRPSIRFGDKERGLRGSCEVVFFDA